MTVVGFGSLVDHTCSTSTLTVAGELVRIPYVFVRCPLQWMRRATNYRDLIIWGRGRYRPRSAIRTQTHHPHIRPLQ